MALKLGRTCSKVFEVVRISALSLSHYSGKVQVKLFERKPTTIEIRHFTENKVTVVEILQKLLDVKKYTAIDLITQQRKLYQVHANLLTRNHQILSQHGIKNATIIKYPELLASQMPVDLEANLIAVEKLPYALDDVVYLAVLDKIQLQQLLAKENFMYRVDILIRKLDATVEIIMVALVKRQFLGKMSLERMEEVIDLLKANKVSTTDIIKDLWVLQYTPQLITDRIAISRENSIDPIKTWMVRCTRDILERYIQRRSDNKLVLGDSTLAEYLAQRLECTSEEAKSLMAKLPALENKSMKKMKESMDFLYTEGFQPHHIRRVPKVLLHSVQTTQRRIRELEQQGVKMDSLHMLTKSRRQYMQYYQALVKSNASKLKAKQSKLSLDATD